MVDTRVKSGHQLRFLLFLLESLKCGHVTEVQDHAFFVIKEDLCTLQYQSLVGVFCVFVPHTDALLKHDVCFKDFPIVIL